MSNCIEQYYKYLFCFSLKWKEIYLRTNDERNYVNGQIITRSNYNFYAANTRILLYQFIPFGYYIYIYCIQLSLPQRNFSKR